MGAAGAAVDWSTLHLNSNCLLKFVHSGHCPGVNFRNAAMHIADLLAEDLMDDINLEFLVHLVRFHCGPLVNESCRDLAELAVAD